MTFVAELEHLEQRLFEEPTKALHEAAAFFEQRTLEHPQPLFALLRRAKPILLLHGIAVVTRYPDVVEVLTRDDAFSVEPYRSAMTRLAGDFILGTDDGPRYERDTSVLRLAAPRSDIGGLTDFMAHTVEGLLPAPGPGQVNVAELSKRSAARLAVRWLGIGGMDEDLLIAITLAMFNDIFVNVRADPGISAAADDAAGKLRAHLDQLIDQRCGERDTQTVLGRLLRMQSQPETAFTDEEIRNSLTGIVVGFIPTVATATTLAIDALLNRGHALTGACDAARQNDTDAVRAYLWEAMRVAPQGPGLLRRASRNYLLAAGTHRETLIPAGTLTFAATQSAMLDDAVVDDPEEFRTDRPAHHYLHFGTGMHACFGRFANAMQLPEIGKVILRQRGLTRASGPEGQLVKEGPFPASLVVTFGG